MYILKHISMLSLYYICEILTLREDKWKNTPKKDFLVVFSLYFFLEYSCKMLEFSQIVLVSFKSKKTFKGIKEKTKGIKGNEMF